jgi:sugar lactone lactonase YvrE
MSADGKGLPAYTHDKDGNPFVGPNDFASDGHGGMYFTTSGDPGPVINGKVFYIAADGTIAQEAGDVHSANGLAVSKDGKILYVVETEGHTEQLTDDSLGGLADVQLTRRLPDPRWMATRADPTR